MKRLAEKRVREAFNWFYSQVSGTSSPTHIPELILTSQSEINIKVTNLSYSLTSIFSLIISIWTDYHMDGLQWTAGLFVCGWGSRPRHIKFNVVVTVVTCMQKAHGRISVVSMSYLTHVYGCLWRALNNAKTILTDIDTSKNRFKSGRRVKIPTYDEVKDKSEKVKS
jgi:hypothetical protein